METLKTIWDKIQKYKDDDNEEQEYTWKPEKCTEYTVPVFSLPSTDAPGSKAKLNSQLSKVLAFIDLNKQRRYSDCCTIMPIPTTNKRLISICGNHRQVSRLIQFMITIGLIEVESNNYSFNHRKDSDNYCKTYRYYVENEEKVKDYCQEHSVNMFHWKNRREKGMGTLLDTCKITSFEPSEVRFSSELHLLKPDNYSVKQFEDYLEDVLYINYPQLDHYQKVADEINEEYYKEYPDLQIRFKPNIKWNKGNKSVKSIGIRATNQLVGAKKEYDPEYQGMYRSEVLEKYKLNLRKDVRSSVPRVTSLLNFGYWVSEDVDFYEIIFNELEREEKRRGTLLDTCKFDEIRHIIKDLHMSGYFDTENMLSKNTFWKMHHDGNYDEVISVMESFKDAVEKAEGGVLYSNEVFYHESCIYLDVLKHLLDDGFFVWEVYDEWFARQEGWTQEEYEQYVTDLVEDIANNYILEIE